MAAGLPASCEHERAARVGVRARHRQRVVGVVLHQLQVERQLVGAQALEDGEDEAARRGVGEVVGVLDAALARRQRLQRAEADAVDQRGRFIERDLGVDRHPAAQNLRTFQTRLPAEPRDVPGSSPIGWAPSPSRIS